MQAWWANPRNQESRPLPPQHSHSSYLLENPEVFGVDPNHPALTDDHYWATGHNIPDEVFDGGWIQARHMSIDGRGYWDFVIGNPTHFRKAQEWVLSRKRPADEVTIHVKQPEGSYTVPWQVFAWADGFKDIRHPHRTSRRRSRRRKANKDNDSQSEYDGAPIQALEAIQHEMKALEKLETPEDIVSSDGLNTLADTRAKVDEAIRVWSEHSTITPITPQTLQQGHASGWKAALQALQTAERLFHALSVPAQELVHEPHSREQAKVNEVLSHLVNLRHYVGIAIQAATEPASDAQPGTPVNPGAPKMTADEIDARAKEFYTRLEAHGIPVDEGTLKAQITTLNASLKHLLDTLEAQEGFRPNPNRPADYATIAQNHKYPLPTSSKGAAKTDAFTIERAAKHVPQLALLSEARRIRLRVSKLEGIAKALNYNPRSSENKTRVKGRLYPTYKLDPTLGRTHSGGEGNPMNWEPELQTLVQMPGHTILVADYQRLEPKVLATLSQDHQFQQDLSGDPYRALAQFIFSTQNPTESQRNAAKIAFLANLYGQTDAGLAAQLGVPKYQAQKIQKAWHNRYPRASNYIETLKERGRQTGYATSYHGRKRKLDKPDPEANDRLAVNNPIQSTAGDLARIGFTNAARDTELLEQGVKFLLTVHDSLIMAIPIGADLNKIQQLLTRDLVDKNDPKFGLSVSFKHGLSWGTAE
jgi:DNA polymerase I-like protein with 3'-5' exonuclease and polymerase domains